MKFKNVAIVGLGLMGGSLAKAIKAEFPETIVSAWDVDSVLCIALEEKVIDNKYESIMDSLDADLIFLALPVDKSIAAFEQLIPNLEEGQVIADLCSVKTVFNKLWNNSNSSGTYVGGHPMAGRELSGYASSDPGIFCNSVFIITDAEEDADMDFVDLIRSIGCKPVFLSSAEHDRIVAGVSHVPQLVATALLNTAGESAVRFAGGGFSDMTRIAGSSFDMWRSVLENNSEEIIRSIDSVVDELNMIKYSLHHGEFVKLEKSFFKSEIIKRELNKVNG